MLVLKFEQMCLKYLMLNEQKSLDPDQRQDVYPGAFFFLMKKYLIVFLTSIALVKALFFQSKGFDIFLISPQKHVVGTH